MHSRDILTSDCGRENDGKLIFKIANAFRSVHIWGLELLESKFNRRIGGCWVDGEKVISQATEKY